MPMTPAVGVRAFRLSLGGQQLSQLGIYFPKTLLWTECQTGAILKLAR
jgi:hypothetical protein